MDETSPESTNTTTPPAAPAPSQSSSSPTIKMNTIFLVALVAAGIVVLVNWVIKFAKDKMEQKSSSSTSAPSTTPAKSSHPSRSSSSSSNSGGRSGKAANRQCFFETSLVAHTRLKDINVCVCAER